MRESEFSVAMEKVFKERIMKNQFKKIALILALILFVIEIVLRYTVLRRIP